MRLGFKPEKVAHQHTSQGGQGKNQRQAGTSGIQLAIGLIVDFQGELIFGLRLLIAGKRVVRYGLVFIDSQEMCVGTNEAFIEDAAGKVVKVLALQRLKVAAGNFGGFGDFIQRNAAHLPFTPQPVAKYAHGRYNTFSGQFLRLTHKCKPNLWRSHQNNR